MPECSFTCFHQTHILVAEGPKSPKLIAFFSFAGHSTEHPLVDFSSQKLNQACHFCKMDAHK
jgi:hypothetical protein